MSELPGIKGDTFYMILLITAWFHLCYKPGVLFNTVSTIDVHTCRELKSEATQENNMLQETNKTTTSIGKNCPAFSMTHSTKAFKRLRLNSKMD